LILLVSALFIYTLSIWNMKEPPSSLFGNLIFAAVHSQSQDTPLLKEHATSLKNKTVLITGGTSGMGKELSKQFASFGSVVYVTALPDENGTHYEHPNIHVLKLDISDFGSITDCLRQLKKEKIKIDIFVSNAGVARSKLFLTKQGFEECFAVNYLGPFIFTNGLINEGLFKKSNTKPRIIFIASDCHQQVPPPTDLKNLGIPFSYGLLDVIKMYGQSKFFLVAFAMELSHRKKGEIDVFSICPGPFFSNIGSDKSPQIVVGIVKFFRWLTNPPVFRAALPVVALACRTDVDSGSYFLKATIKEISPRASDAKFRKELWEKTCEIITRHPKK